MRPLALCALLLSCLGSALFSVAPAAFAQEAAPQPASGARAVAVVDAAGDVTEDARLRAVVYERLRGRGVEAAQGVDVMATAGAVDALSGPAVSKDPASLERLRARLGVAWLVRVAEEWRRDGQVAIHVVVVGAGGPRSKIVAGRAGELATTLTAVLDELLAEALPPPPPPKREEPPPPPEPEPAPKWTVHGGAAHPPPEAPQKSAEEAWGERLGVRGSWGVHAVIMAERETGVVAEDQNPVTGAVESGRGSLHGIGGGVGLRGGLLFSGSPDPMGSGGGFPCFRAAVGPDLSVLYARGPVDLDYKIQGGAVVDQEVEQGNRALLHVNGVAELGPCFAVGRFRAGDSWRGVGIGLSWAPAYAFRMEIGTGTADARWVLPGFMLSFDFIALESRAESAEPHIRAFAHVLPNGAPDDPLLIALGFGATWF